MRSAVALFQEHNPAWQSTVSITTDKDFVERGVSRDLMPNAHLLICLYHTLRTFRREIHCEKMSLKSAERDVCLGIVRNMVYSATADQYDEHFTRLKATPYHKVIDYVTNAWHPIRSEWVQGLKEQQFTLGETTNNRLESINQKIKSVCTRHACLQRFFSEFCSVLSSLRNERIHKALSMCNSRPMTTIEKLAAYQANVTPYAYK